MADAKSWRTALSSAGRGRLAARADDRSGAYGVGALTWLGNVIAGAARGLADVIVPPVCLACQRPLASLDALCPRCWRQVRFIRPPLCDRLGIPMPYDTGGIIVSAGALADPPDWDRARAAAHFEHVVRDLVHKLKYQDRHDPCRLLARWIASAGEEILREADVLVPVPLHRWRLISRKFNQAALLAHEVSRLTCVPCDPLVLTRRKSTPSQVGLTAAERRRNLSGAFEVAKSMRERIAGKRVVLIDDVITTGSTMGACARVLKRAGAAQVDVLAVAMVTDETRIGL